MEQIERSIDVNVPVRTAYNQWTQFEEFPLFMTGVRRVWQLDDKRLRWQAQLGGIQKEWDAEIVEQLPDRHVIWQSIGGAPNRGTVLFEPIDQVRTRVIVRLEYDPNGFLENLGSSLGVVSRYIEGALLSFKSFIESRGEETGAWRGEIHRGTVQPGGSDHLQDITTAESIEQAVGGGTTNAGITGDQPLPPTGAPLPHSYGTSGDLQSDTPGATTGEERQTDASSRMAQMSGGQRGQGPQDDVDTGSRMAQMSGGQRGQGPQDDVDTGSRMAQMSGGQRRGETSHGGPSGAGDLHGERRGRSLPNNEGLVDSDIPSDLDQR